ncbi:O-antigen ligase family protein [Ralstonia pickettii]|nr:O-antigen ligase family protein [Ralstonia pickettii]
MGPFVALASVAYIFRFPGPIGDLSLFRIALFVYAFCAITKILVSSSAVVRGDVVRLVVSGALIVAPTIIDVIFLTNDQALIRVVYSFWANMAFWAAFSLTVDRRHLEYYLRWYCFVAVFESAIAIYGYVTMKFPLDFLIYEYGTDYAKGLSVFNVNDGFVRLTGTFFDPNFYGIYLASVLAIAVWLYIYREKKVFYLLLSGLCFCQLILTTSRTSLLALGGVAAAFVAYQGIAAWVVLLIFLVVMAGGLSIGLLDPAIFDKMFSGESVSDRFSFFERGLNGFLSNPIFGGGSEAIVDPESGLSTAHSVYLSVLGRNGLFGMLCFFLAMIIIIKPVMVVGRRDMATRHFVVQMFLLVAISFVAYDTLYYFEPLYILFAMMFVCMKTDVSGSVSTYAASKGRR